jgi:outer membrane biosynthesis protein TonB
MKLDKDRRRGVIGTILVHVTLLVFLLFVALRTPLPLPGEEGVEVNLGFDESGMGNIQSDEAPPKEEPQPQPQKVTPPPEIIEPEPEPVEEDIITQDIEEAPAIEEKEEKEPEPEPEEKPEEIKEVEPVKEEIIEKEPVEEIMDSIPLQNEPVEEEVVVEDPKPVVNKRALYTGSTSDGQGTSQGVTEGGGDQGKPHGYKESDKYDGKGGSGNGIQASLGGRGTLYLEKPSSRFTEQGKVVIDIWVDKTGVVKKAQVNTKGTNIIDPNLKKIAVDAAYNSKFTQDQSAVDLQRGTITYNFILMK